MFAEVVIFFALMICTGGFILRICKEGDYDDYDD
jgi:hypothetical protein